MKNKKYIAMLVLSAVFVFMGNTCDDSAEIGHTQAQVQVQVQPQMQMSSYVTQEQFAAGPTAESEVLATCFKFNGFDANKEMLEVQTEQFYRSFDKAELTPVFDIHERFFAERPELVEGSEFVYAVKYADDNRTHYETCTISCIGAAEEFEAAENTEDQ